MKGSYYNLTKNKLNIKIGIHRYLHADLVTEKFRLTNIRVFFYLIIFWVCPIFLLLNIKNSKYLMNEDIQSIKNNFLE